MLHDLELLVLKVRHPESRKHFREAVRAYHGGAYRAALMSTWVAVCSDFFEKVGELAALGDAAAQAYEAELKHAVQTNHIYTLQKLEQNLLDVASSQFEFMGAREKTDLERLKEDRNLCAHPAFVGEGMFEPSAELVRLHFVHAVSHLLEHPPTQGKTLLEQVDKDLGDYAFPLTLEATGQYVRQKYLKSSKLSTRRAVVKLLFQRILEADLRPRNPVPSEVERAVRMLKIIAQDQPGVLEDLLSNSAPGNPLLKVSGLQGEHLGRLTLLLTVDERVWTWLDSANQARFEQFLFQTLQSEPTAPLLWQALETPSFQPRLLEQYHTLSAEERTRILTRMPHPVLKDDALKLLKETYGFRNSEQCLRIVLTYAKNAQLEKSDYARVLELWVGNNQIWDAGGAPPLLYGLAEQAQNQGCLDVELWTQSLGSLVAENPSSADQYQGLSRLLERMREA